MGRPAAFSANGNRGSGEQGANVDIGKAISFVPEDQNWLTKLGIGALVSSVPVLNFAWNGYLVDLMRNVAAYDPRPLPEWDDFGDKFMRGLMISLAMLIYGLPALLLACFGFAAVVGPSLAATQETVEALAAASGGLLVIALCCIGIYALALTFFFPAVFINYARQGTFVACFQLGALVRIITTNLGDYLLAWAVTLGVSVVLGLALSAIATIASFIPCVGWIGAWVASALAGAWGATIFAHLFGQVGARAPLEGGENVGL
jgi:hypothetical protein